MNQGVSHFVDDDVVGEARENYATREFFRGSIAEQDLATLGLVAGVSAL